MRRILSRFTFLLLLLLSGNSGNSAPQFPRKGGEGPTATLEKVIVASGAQNILTLAPGPDVIAGDVFSLQQFGSSGTQVGLAMGTDACNNGDMQLNFFAMPNTDHPVTAQNLYRMSGGATNDDRFEQIGQSWLTHGFAALQSNSCNFGCIPASNGSHLGAGCSSADSASINAGPINLGSRAWVNPFTGAFPSTANSHAGHMHNGTSHRVLVEASDLNISMNPGATYYAETQYLTPHEYAWCQTHLGECNMYNNASYRRFNVAGTTSFTFSAVGATVRMTPAINAWNGATMNMIEPEPGVDGRALIAYKVTNPSANVWHYEYAIYNQDLDRSIQSFSVSLGCGITVSNVGFHAPPNHPGFPNDGTAGDAGFSNAPWTSNQTTSELSWSSETLGQNPNANAIRFGTLYNFRFDSNRPPQPANATIGFFKTGSPIAVAIQSPAADPCNPLQLLSAVSRMRHGSAGDFSIDLPLTGEPGVECRNGSGNYTLVVTFSNAIVSGRASVTHGAGSVTGSSAFNGNTMTIHLTGVTDVQRITVSMSEVTDAFAQVLPDTSIDMNVLIGDATGNKLVSASDVSIVKSQAGRPVTGANFRDDTTADGSIDSSDIALIKSTVGHGMP